MNKANCILMALLFVATSAIAQFSGTTGNTITPGWIVGGDLRVGRDDVVAGHSKIYGDLTTQGGKLTIFNARGEDTTTNQWIWEAADTLLLLGTEDTGNLFQFGEDGSFIASGAFTAASLGLTGNLDVGGTIEAGSGNTTLTSAAGELLDAAMSSNVAHLNAAETIAANWVNTANPWLDAEVADDITLNSTKDINTTLLYKTSGTQISSDDLSDTASIGMLDEAETLTGNWVNTTNPWADNEVSDSLTVTGYMQDTDIDTFSELQSWVTDKVLVNTTDAASMVITGGSIDGTVVGGSTPAAGSFTTLDASGGITGTDGLRISSNEDHSSSWWTDGEAQILITNANASGDAVIKFAEVEGRIVYGQNVAGDSLIFSSRESAGTVSEQIIFDNNGNGSFGGDLGVGADFAVTGNAIVGPGVSGNLFEIRKDQAASTRLIINNDTHTGGFTNLRFMDGTTATAGNWYDNQDNEYHIWAQEAGSTLFLGAQADHIQVESSGQVTLTDGLTVGSNIDTTNGTIIANNTSSAGFGSISAVADGGAQPADAFNIRAIGSTASTAGGFVQDGTSIDAGVNMTGGMSLMTRNTGGAADIRIYTGGHTNLRATFLAAGGLDIVDGLDVGGDVLPALDGVSDLGASAVRWADLFADNITVTSDITSATLTSGSGGFSGDFQVQGQFGFGTADSVTLSGDVLTATATHIDVEAQTGTADTLESITQTGWNEGEILILRAATGDTITVLHSGGGGGGDILTLTAGSRVLSLAKMLICMYDGADFREIVFN